MPSGLLAELSKIGLHVICGGIGNACPRSGVCILTIGLLTVMHVRKHSHSEADAVAFDNGRKAFENVLTIGFWERALFVPLQELSCRLPRQFAVRLCELCWLCQMALVSGWAL